MRRLYDIRSLADPEKVQPNYTCTYRVERDQSYCEPGKRKGWSVVVTEIGGGVGGGSGVREREMESEGKGGGE